MRSLQVADRWQPRKVELSWSILGPYEIHVPSLVNRKLLFEVLVHLRQIDRGREGGAPVVRALIGRIGWRGAPEDRDVAARVYGE